MARMADDIDNIISGSRDFNGFTAGDSNALFGFAVVWFGLQWIGSTSEWFNSDLSLGVATQLVSSAG
ncbi:hypothetical protein Hanom_Chr01g00062201 [Helianthus anomalus]